jgi:MFS family permease
MTVGPEPADGPPGGGNRYRLALSTPGALGFVIPGILARFPIGMTSISILLFISSVRHEYGTAGALSATSALGYAVTAPQLARMADRVGQRRILLVCAALCGVSGAVFVECALRAAPLWTLVASAAAMGATTPAIGSMVRARWSGLLAGSPILATAFAMESVADEVIFIAGPVIATFLATGVHPAAGLVCSVALVSGGSAALALSRPTERLRTVGPRAAGSALLLGPVPVIAGVNACFGAMWGSIDMATVSFSTAQHHPSAAGLLLAAYGIGSSVAGTAYGAREWNTPVSHVFQAATGLMAVGIAPMLLVNDLLVGALVLFLAGAASCPAIVAGMLLVQHGVPASRRTEAMAWQSTAIWLGVAIGSSASGHLADTLGSHAAYTFAMICGGIGFGIARVGRHRVALKPAAVAV